MKPVHMKKYSTPLLIIVILTLIISCTSQHKEPNRVKEIVEEPFQIDPVDISDTEPILQTAAELESKADNIIVINESNIVQTLEEARNYRQAFIVVGIHTIVEITDFDDCQNSNLWKACMPKGNSIIQKSGSFEKKNDYINNIIGKPDGQTRKMYLFK